MFIVHRPYFQHPATKLFWAQEQAYEWKILPDSLALHTDPHILRTLREFLFEVNHYKPQDLDLQHTSLGPKHELILFPIDSKNPKELNGLVMKNEKLNYLDYLFQDSQDPYDDFEPMTYWIFCPKSSNTSRYLHGG